ncbi:MAG: DUF3299 domain-containing protein [Pseudomonadota bacterium]
MRMGMRWIAAAAAAMIATAAPAGAARAEAPIDLSWDMLAPAADPIASLQERLAALGLDQDGAPMLGGYVSHGQSWLSADDPDLGTQLVRDFDGKTVRLPGYVVPLDFDDGYVENFLLVPFIGACVHVPPPPPNQIVMVSLAEKRKLGLFEAIYVTGPILATPVSSEIAEIGYQINAPEIDPYDDPNAYIDPAFLGAGAFDPEGPPPHAPAAPVAPGGPVAAGGVTSEIGAE